MLPTLSTALFATSRAPTSVIRASANSISFEPVRSLVQRNGAPSLVNAYAAESPVRGGRQALATHRLTPTIHALRVISRITTRIWASPLVERKSSQVSLRQSKRRAVAAEPSVALWLAAVEEAAVNKSDEPAVRAGRGPQLARSRASRRT